MDGCGSWNKPYDSKFWKSFRDEWQEEQQLHREQREQTPGAQKIFIKKVQRLTNVIEEMGNPFSKETGDLLVLDSKNIADSIGVDVVATHLDT